MEKLLDPQITKQIHQVFEGIQEPVQVLLFTSKANCDYCDEARQLLEEVIALNDKLELRVHDIDENEDLASRFNVTKTAMTSRISASSSPVFLRVMNLAP
jgi:glutaredoxin